MSENEGGRNGRQGDESSLDARLQAARRRHGLDAAPSANRRASGWFGGSALGIGLRVGVELVSALVIALGIGWALDHWLHTIPLFLVVFLLLGGAAGVLNVWRVFPSGGQRTGTGTGTAKTNPDAARPRGRDQEGA